MFQLTSDKSVYGFANSTCIIFQEATFMAKQCPFINKFGASSHFSKSKKHKDTYIFYNSE